MPKSHLETNGDIPERNVFEVIRCTPNAKDEYQVGKHTVSLRGTPKTFIEDKGVADELYARHSPEVGDGTLCVIPVEKRVQRGTRRTWLVSLPRNYRRGDPAEENHVTA